MACPLSPFAQGFTTVCSGIALWHATLCRIACTLCAPLNTNHIVKYQHGSASVFCAEIHRPHHFHGAFVLSDVLPVPSHAAALCLLQLYTGLVSTDPVTLSLAALKTHCSNSSGHAKTRHLFASPKERGCRDLGPTPGTCPWSGTVYGPCKMCRSCSYTSGDTVQQLTLLYSVFAWYFCK